MSKRDVITVHDLIGDPWLAGGVLILFLRTCVIAAIIANLFSSTYGCVLAAMYALAKLAESLYDERARRLNAYSGRTN